MKKWIWTANSNGQISVKSAYWLGRRENPPTSQDVSRGEIWKTKIHERLKMHLWRIAANYLPTKSLLARYINIGDTTCSLCGMEEEICLHLFVMCPLTKAIWFNSHWGFKFDGLGLSSSSQFIQTLISPPNTVGLTSSNKAEFLLHDAVICDVVWKLRNQVQFEEISPNLDGMLLKISRSVAKFRKILESPLGSSSNRFQSAWSKLDRDTIKINVVLPATLRVHPLQL